MHRRNIFKKLHAAILFCLVMEICFVNEANPHPLRNSENTKHLTRDKRDIDILAECNTECLPEDEIKEYDLLLYYEYEEVKEYPLLYSYPDTYEGKGKSCMYPCIIIELNDTNSVETTTFREESTTTLDQTNSLENHTTTLENIRIEIGNRFNIHSVKPDIMNKLNSTTLTSPLISTMVDSSTSTNKPIILIPKKLIITVIEAEMMEVVEKPPTFTTIRSITLKETQATVLDEMPGHLVEGDEHGMERIPHATTMKSLDEQENSTSPQSNNNNEGISNFLKINTTADKTLANDVIVKVANTGTNGSFGKLFINDSEVKCKIYLINENSPIATNTNKIKLNVSDLAKKEPTKEAGATPNISTPHDKSEEANFKRLRPLNTNLTKMENSNFGNTAIVNYKTKNVTLIHENNGLKNFSGVEEGDPNTYWSGNNNQEQNVTSQNLKMSIRPELEIEQNVTDTNLLVNLTAEMQNTKVLNLNVDNYSFHGNFTTKSKSGIPEQLQKQLVENLRKLDNTSTVIVSPESKETKSITKLDKVR